MKTAFLTILLATTACAGQTNHTPAVGQVWRSNITDNQVTVESVMRGGISTVMFKWKFPAQKFYEAAFLREFVWVSDPTNSIDEPQWTVVGVFTNGGLSTELIGFLTTNRTVYYPASAFDNPVSTGFAPSSKEWLPLKSFSFPPEVYLQVISTNTAIVTITPTQRYTNVETELTRAIATNWSGVGE